MWPLWMLLAAASLKLVERQGIIGQDLRDPNRKQQARMPNEEDRIAAEEAAVAEEKRIAAKEAARLRQQQMMQIKELQRHIEKKDAAKEAVHGQGSPCIALAVVAIQLALHRFGDQLLQRTKGVLSSAATLCTELYQMVSGKRRTRDEKIQAALTKLDKVVGVDGVKAFIRSLRAQLKFQAARREARVSGPDRCAGNLHMIFTGSPGTGKTTVAQLVAELLAAMGLLRKGHLTEVKRCDLVGEAPGQTAPKVKKVVEEALGGVLFIDEAYSLVYEGGRDSFGREALDALSPLIEENREDLVVILAGYPDDMARLVSTNPGLRSRFPTNVHFEDYSGHELFQIAEQMISNPEDYFELSDDAGQTLLAVLDRVASAGGREAGNGRAVRNIVEDAKRKMSVRLEKVDARNRQILCTLEAADFV